MSIQRNSRKGLALAVALALFGVLAAGRAEAAKAKAARVDLNSASQKELEDLPGVGAATAKKIIAARPYSSVSDLSRAGVSAKTIDKIRDRVTVGPGSAGAAAGMEKSDAKSSAREARKESAASSGPGAGSSKSRTGAPSPVDLNTASQKELEDLPGVGAATAKKIIANRPYTSVADLSRAKVSAKTIEKISPLVTVSSPASSSRTSSSNRPEASSSRSASSAPPSSSSSSAAPSSSSGSRASSSGSQAEYQPPPAKGMVWVNLDTRIYHREGDRWYGKTKNGKYMSEADAIKAGYRLSKEKDEPK